MEATCPFLGFFQGTQPPEGIEQCEIKLDQTEHQPAHQHGELMTSLVYVQIHMNTVTTTIKKGVNQGLFFLSLLCAWDEA